ncbi:MAG: formylmethanofuran dehydrogenase subunit B [Bacillota bacterium]
MPVIESVVCTFCGSLCDDLRVTVEQNRVLKVGGACALGRQKVFHDCEPTAVWSVEGMVVDMGTAMEEAARVLSSARFPLVYGLSTVSTEAQREAVALAELLGGTVDTTSSHCHGPSTMARQQAGLPTCTLGEVRNRADLIIFWGCNPMESSPRHLARYSAMAKGSAVTGRGQRRVVVVDVRPTPTAKAADEFIQIDAGRDYEAFTLLRSLIQGKAVPEDVTTTGSAGVPFERWARLAALMKGCRYGVAFFGMGLTMSGGREANLELLLTTVAELNAFTRFYAIPMRGHSNVAGSENVLAWLTGYPFAVNFSRGYPRYGPGEFTVVDLLERGDVDACLVVGADPAAHLPRRCVKHLESIPVVLVDPHVTLTTPLARVTIPVAAGGVGAEGTFYRMDNVPLRAAALVESRLPTDEEVIRTIRERITRAQDR